MLLDSSALVTETNCTLQGQAFKIKASSLTFDILTGKLYSNPTLAIVRELLTNAYDSQKAVGKEDVPIKVTVPIGMETSFSIRDYGLGLSKEDVLELYTTFFESTKSNTNDFTGCFGLGSKTPFSYTSSFTVHSYFNGIKYSFLVIKKDGLPFIYCINEQETEEENGLEVVIPTDKDSHFLSETLTYLKYIPEIKVTCAAISDREKPIVSIDSVSLYKISQHRYYYYQTGTIYIKQGQNVYNVTEQCPKTFKLIHNFLKHVDIVKEVSIGTLGITPNREHLNTACADELEKQLHLTTSELTKFIDSEDMMRFNLSSMYSELLTAKYFEETLGVTLQVNSSNIYNVDMKKINSYTLTYDGVCKGASILSNTKTIVLMTRNVNTEVCKRIQRILNNYNLTDVTIKLINPSKQIRYMSTQDFYKHTLKVIRCINKITETTFNVKAMTTKGFFKKYPNSRGVREVNFKRLIRYNNVSISINLITSNLTIGSYTKSKLARVEDLHSKFCLSHTLITYNDEDFLKKVSALSVLASIKNSKTKENVLLPLIQKNLHPNILSEATLHILMISKVNRKHFKDYTVVNLDKLIDDIYSQPWKVRTHNHEVEIKKFLDKVDQMFTDNFDKRTCKYLYTTKLYKRLKIIQRYIDNYLKDTTYIQHRLFLSYIKPERRTEPLQLSSLHKCIKEVQSVWNSRYINNYQGKEVIKIPNAGKELILQLTKEVKPNDVFQR